MMEFLGTRHEQVAVNEFLLCTGLGIRSRHGKFGDEQSENSLSPDLFLRR